MKTFSVMTHLFILVAIVSTTFPVQTITTTQSPPSPTPYIYAQLSVQVYNADGGRPPEGWKVLTTSTKEGVSTLGYFGAAYINRATKQMIIAHRGTDCANVLSIACATDLAGDDSKILGDEVPEQMIVAKGFIVQALTKYGAVFNLPLDTDFKQYITFTGHSLGAVLAELSAHEFDSTAVTFDSPGSRSIIPKYRPNLSPDDTRIVSYQAAPHAINRAHEHVGHIYRVFPPFNGVPVNGLAMIQQHSKDGILAQFNPETGMPLIVSDLGIGGNNGSLGRSFLFINDLDAEPNILANEFLPFWTKIYGVNEALKRFGGVNSDIPNGQVIVGDNTKNHIWGDQTGTGTLIGNGGADILDSWGGNDVMSGGQDNAPDTYRLITRLGTSGNRVISDTEAFDNLEWDGGTVEGIPSPIRNNLYVITIHNTDISDITLELTVEASGLKITSIDGRNSVLILGWQEGWFGIYLAPRNVEKCESPVSNSINGGYDGKPIEGTCANDSVNADTGKYSETTIYDDNIHTYAGDDWIDADPIFDVNHYGGMGGRDIVDAGPGYDHVYGGYDDDVIYGGLGNDILDGGEGADMLVGGEGNDYISGGSPDTGDTAFGGSGNDRIGVDKDGFIDGGDGDDFLQASTGSTMVGGLGNDEIRGQAGTIQYGNEGDDRLYNDPSVLNNTVTSYLNGGSGDDALYNYSGRVVMDGGSGNNAYIFRPLSSLTSTRIVGFDSGALSQIFISTTPGGSPVPITEYQLSYDYDKLTGNLTITVNAPARTQNDQKSLVDTPVQFVVENYHNGMLGLAHIEGAPDMPTSPFVGEPGVTNSKTLYLPLVRR